MSEIKLACEVAEQVKAICDKHGNLPGELINILHEAQHLQGYLRLYGNCLLCTRLRKIIGRI